MEKVRGLYPTPGIASPHSSCRSSSMSFVRGIAAPKAQVGGAATPHPGLPPFSELFLDLAPSMLCIRSPTSQFGLRCISALCSSSAQVSGSVMLPKSGEILPTFQRPFLNSTFAV